MFMRTAAPVDGALPWDDRPDHASRDHIGGFHLDATAVARFDRLLHDVANLRRVREGGIGLELIGRLCEHLGWRLDIRSLPSKGTRVTLDLSGRALTITLGGEDPALLGGMLLAGAALAAPGLSRPQSRSTV